MEKSFEFLFKINFTPNTSGYYGLNGSRLAYVGGFRCTIDAACSWYSESDQPSRTSHHVGDLDGYYILQ